jgi:hypothetical protein
MRIHSRPSHTSALAALLFGLSGYFASLSSTAIPDLLRQHIWLAYPLLLICLIGGTFLLRRSQRPPVNLTGLEEEYEDYLYHYGATTAASVRLIGAADEWFPPEVVHVQPSSETYSLPDDFLATRDEVLGRLQEEADRHNRLFFDGPNTRLISYACSPVEATEQKHLTLVLGPIGWYDYSVAKWHLDIILNPLDRERLRRYVDLDEIAESGNLRNSALTNILCTAITFITADGYLTYSKRSDRVSAQALKYTSCVAENIHQDKDRSLQQVPGELPAPYRAAIRGIEEEVSPQLADVVRKHLTWRHAHRT